jgi:hypothetical protein
MMYENRSWRARAGGRLSREPRRRDGFDQRTGHEVPEVGGTALGHFGAFLQQRWRENDILWGRLDGAERIISSVLPQTIRKNHN